MFDNDKVIWDEYSEDYTFIKRNDVKDNDNTVIWDVYNDVGDNTIDIFDDVYIRKYLCGLQENDYRKENDHENKRGCDNVGRSVF